MVAASLVGVFAVSQAASASGRCYWWWRQNGVTHYDYYDCAHPIRPPWEGGPGASTSAAAAPAAAPQGGHMYANSYSFGQCTWWAAQTRRDENLERLGNAGMWAINARLRGLRVGSTPHVGATAVFGPGVQGASWLGHVAHVVRVSGSRFEVSEMNYYGGTPRGGWGRVDYRWANTGGVSFIY